MSDLETLRRGWRDQLKDAGLSRREIETIVEWHRTNERTLPNDPAGVVNAFVEDAIYKYHLSNESIDLAVSAFSLAGREGPRPTTPETDAATILAAEALLKKDATAYWRDPDLRERYSEALERTAAAKAEPVLDRLSDAVRRSVETTDGVERFADMLRTDPRRYWGSTKIQADHRLAIQTAIDSPTSKIPDLPWPGAPTSPPEGTTAQ